MIPAKEVTIDIAAMIVPVVATINPIDAETGKILYQREPKVDPNTKFETAV